MIPKAFIEEVLNRTNLEHLVSGYVSLKRAGTNLTGLCPFHSEKTPSFTVYPSEGNFYCFGCGTGGDAITFIRKIENLDYPDAVEMLAGKIGLTVPQEDNPRLSTGQPHADRKRVLLMNKEAARFFHAALYQNTSGSAEALAYLSDKRGLSASTIRHFGLGYAPDSFSALSDHLLSLGFTELELTDGFMAFKNSFGKLTDSFRNRVMFPIIDPAGNVIAFGGRVMDDSLPKYKNTSDTPAFKKSKHLFALNFARNSCAERLILCEGYMDVISLHAAGFENAVATLGTAITPDQARIISRYTKSVIISYDMDEAGRRAADKAMKLFEEVGLEVKLLKLTGAKDPDEYIRKNGADAFRKTLDASDSKFAYNLNRVLNQYDIQDPQQKIKALSELIRIVSHFSSASEREIYLQEISRIFDVETSVLKRDLGVALARIKKERQEKESQTLLQGSLGYRDTVNPDSARAPAVARFEESVLGLLLVYPEFCKYCGAESSLLTKSDFYTEFGKRVFEYILSSSDGREEENINELFTPDEVGRIVKMKVGRMILSENSETVFLDTVKALKNAVSLHTEPTSGASLDTLAKIIAMKADEDKT